MDGVVIMEANADEPTVAVYFRAKGTRTYVLIDSGTPAYAHGILTATYRTKRGLGGDVQEEPIASGKAPATIKSAEMANFKQAQINAYRARQDVIDFASDLALLAQREGGRVTADTGTNELKALATAAELRHAHGLKAYTMSRYALFAGTPATYEVNIADR